MRQNHPPGERFQAQATEEPAAGIRAPARLRKMESLFVDVERGKLVDAQDPLYSAIRLVTVG